MSASPTAVDAVDVVVDVVVVGYGPAGAAAALGAHAAGPRCSRPAAGAVPVVPAFPAGRSIEYRVVSGGDGRRGAQLWQRLDDAVRGRDIAVRFGTA